VDVKRVYFETLRSAASSDPAIQVRIAATEALGQYSEQGLSTLIGLAASSNADLARAALSSLGAVGSPGSVPVLLSAINGEDRDLRPAAIRALAASGQPNAVAAIAEVAMSSDSVLAEEAIKALGQIDSASSLEALLEIATSPKRREIAAAALSQIAPGQIGRLASRLPTVPIDVRRLAVEVLSRVRSQEAMDVLETALDDPEPAVRHSAFCALTHIRRADRPVHGTADAEGVQ
jgi:HEAT repeat protein